MQSNKKSWLVPLLILVWLVTIFILAPANCRHNTTDKTPPSTVDEKAQTCTNSRGESGAGESPKRNVSGHQPACADDNDCPSDSSCLNGVCVVTNPTDNEEGEDDEEFDAGDRPETTRSCATVEDCGCGYDCAEGECHKVNSTCCANADCKVGDFCYINSRDKLNGNGTCMFSECDTDDECGGQCGMHCNNHQCSQSRCCTNTDCPTGDVCIIFDGVTEGHCFQAQCTSDTDCGCGQICNTTYYVCTKKNPDNRPMSCCGTDFYYEGACLPHEYIENGRCLEDSHCLAGQVCYDQRVCLPATCTNNANCGCEAVCRKGHCEEGCDTNNDCCNQGDICDRGDCLDPNIEQ